MKRNSTKIITLTLLTFVTLFTTACYRMPTESDYSTIPITNNRDVTREKGGWQPTVGY